MDRSTTDEATFDHDELAQDGDALWSVSAAFRRAHHSRLAAVTAYVRATDQQRAAWWAKHEGVPVECVLARFEANRRLAAMAAY